MRTRGPATIAAITFLAAACGGASSLPIGGGYGAGGEESGGNPLVGTWVGVLTGGTSGSETVTFDADGSLIVTDQIASVGGTCSGSIQLTGLTWSSTATTITLSGTSTCTGALQCPNGTIPCTSTQTAAQTCDYSLSDGDGTLVLTCQGQSTTLTRQS